MRMGAFAAHMPVCRSRMKHVAISSTRRSLNPVPNGGGGIMILGMSMAIVLVHVVISLIAIVAGVVVMFAMLGSEPGRA